MSGYRRQRSTVMHLDADPKTVFPLLCPVRETEWIDSWRCEVVYTDSGRAEADCVFKTAFPGDGPEDVWVVSRYEPPRVIEFIRTNALRVMRYTITLEPAVPGARAVWTQVMTGLNPEGDRFVAALDDAAFTRRMAELERMLNHFLTTGRMLAGD
jgi:hypothetical protein